MTVTDIRDAADRENVVGQWNVVEQFALRSHRTTLIGGTMYTEAPPDTFYNLPLVLAYGVLDQLLGIYAQQGAFHVRRKATLGEKMEASRSLLPWMDFNEVQAGKDRRNDVAHQGVLQSREDCLKYVGAVRTELCGWGVIQASL